MNKGFLAFECFILAFCQLRCIEFLFWCNIHCFVRVRIECVDMNVPEKGSSLQNCFTAFKSIVDIRVYLNEE